MMMSFSSAAGRRALAFKQPAALRNFSAGLLVPLKTRAEAPAEITANNISEYAHSQLQEKYAVFNE